jgi:hypothetical protein
MDHHFTLPYKKLKNAYGYTARSRLGIPRCAWKTPRRPIKSISFSNISVFYMERRARPIMAKAELDVVYSPQ